ncbi:DinB family protein [Rhizobium sp. PDO1-076]|uniref:DinB family protein n=1 Tax=Rhizobium sp. PDO1-076 TaxID=1125979 RepID=UPI00024E2472|nr:DinB family protein [Rhizobium sp. PDO1-076]EHS48757.1 DinB family protein [Rhizobium sp. PDO1-076]
MTDPSRVFRKLALNNAMANWRLHAALVGLKPGEFESPRIGFFPSLKTTLNHILIVDWFYVDALEGGTLGPKAWENEQPFDNPLALYGAQLDVDRRLIDLCTTIGAFELTRVIAIHRGSRVQYDRMDDVLSHLFQHQTHHRGQVHAMLAGTSVKPPQLDEFITGDDADNRLDAMKALGLSEDDVML